MRRAIAARHARSPDAHIRSAQLCGVANGICNRNARGRAPDTHAWADDANAHADSNRDAYSSTNCNTHGYASDAHAHAVLPYPYPYADTASHLDASPYLYSDGHSNAYDYAHARASSLGGGVRAE